MENENDIQATEETTESSEVAEETTEEAVDWKAKAEEAEKRIKALEFKAIKQREKSKELKAKSSEPEAEKKPSDFDYGQKAFLKTYGISGADELALVKTFVDRGENIDNLVTDEYFNNKLKLLREAKAVKEAIPQSTKRSTGTLTNKVEFWTEKYMQGAPLNEVPQELRREVLNARLKAEEQKRKFG